MSRNRVPTLLSLPDDVLVQIFRQLFATEVLAYYGVDYHPNSCHSLGQTCNRLFEAFRLFVHIFHLPEKLQYGQPPDYYTCSQCSEDHTEGLKLKALTELSGPGLRATELHFDAEGLCSRIRIRLLREAKKLTRLTVVNVDGLCDGDAPDIVEFLESKPFIHTLNIDSPGFGFFSNTSPALPRLRNLQVHKLSSFLRHALVVFLVAYGDQLVSVQITVDIPDNAHNSLFIGVESNNNSTLNDHEENDNVDDDNSDIRLGERSEKMADLYKTLPPFVGILAAHFLSIEHISFLSMHVVEKVQPPWFGHDPTFPNETEACPFRLSGHCPWCTTPSQVSPQKAGTNFGRLIGMGVLNTCSPCSSTASTTTSAISEKLYSLPFVDMDISTSFYTGDFILIPPVCRLFDEPTPTPVALTSCVPTAARLDALLDINYGYGADHISKLHALELACSLPGSICANVFKANWKTEFVNFLKNAAPSVRLLRIGGKEGPLSVFCRCSKLLLQVITALPNVTVLDLGVPFLMYAFTFLRSQNGADGVSFNGTLFLKAAKNVRVLEIVNVGEFQEEYVFILPALLTALGSTCPMLSKIITQNDQCWKWESLVVSEAWLSKAEEAIREFQRRRGDVCVTSIERFIDSCKGKNKRQCVRHHRQ